jgi:exodeoxyribonuclease VII large subunit
MSESKPGSTEESALSVGSVSAMVGDWIGRLGAVWIEGQLAEVKERRSLSYLSIRDVETDVSLQAHCSPTLLDEAKVEQGSRVLVYAKATWWPKRGDLQFKVGAIRAVGVGELMARLEALRALLDAEGLFSQSRKKPLPFLPRRVGLICGANSMAMHDVIENARRRWPDIEFEIREVPVQGTGTVAKVSAALRELDAQPEVDVIVIARGGGSFEDLLAFSDETLLRAVANTTTPVVSAIGHEEDRPLLDLVADYRASTPTDAGKAIVPDVASELAAIRDLRARSHNLVRRNLDQLAHQLAITLARPSLASPATLIEARIVETQRAATFISETVHNRIRLETARLAGTTATLRALSPQGTLERGYAITRDANGRVIKTVAQSEIGQELFVRLSDGTITVSRSK